MTLFLVDIASYQGALTPEAVRSAGFGGVNLKISHGLGRQSVHPDVAGWTARAKALGLAVSTFHWLTADTPGEAQAEHAYRQISALGLEAGTAHQLDVESTPAPSLSSVRGYLTRMTELLGRPVALYTGDWWWKPRGWNVSDLAPYLWAAPNAGYLDAFPGIGSPAWSAGYGGWPELAVMQFAVAPLPGTSVKVSMSAVRFEKIWRELTLGRSGMSYAPASILAARTLAMNTMRAAGVTVNPASYGVVGDDSHAKAGTGYHLGEDALTSTAYSIVESSRDRNGLTNAASAFDHGWFSINVRGKNHNLRSFSLWLVAQCKAGTADTKDIREVIYSPDGATVKRWDRLGVRSTGDDSHLTHTHISYFRDSESRDKTALFKRYYAEIGLTEDDMPTAEEIVTEMFNRKVIAGGTDYGTFNGVMGTLMARTGNLANSYAPAWSQSLNAILANVVADDNDRAQIIAAVNAAQAETAGDVAQAVRDAFGSPETSAQDVADALVAALGTAKAAAVKPLLP